jgi:hypothetical protein
MEAKASMVIMSHLSDAQELLSMMDDHKFAQTISDEINFAKYLLLKVNGNLNLIIDAAKMYEEYQKLYKK